MLQGKIKSLEQIFLFSLPVKEYQIVESFLQSSLKDEVMKIMPVQKQTRAGQRTRFKVFPSLRQKEISCPAISAEGYLSRETEEYTHFGACSRKLCLSGSYWVQAFVVVGDNNGHVGLGVKCAKEVSPVLPSGQLQMS